MKKRTISWLLIAVLLISISGLPAALAEGEEPYDVKVEGDVKTVVVNSYTYDESSSVFIDGAEASEAAQTEGSPVTVESGAPGNPVVEVTVEGAVTNDEGSGWNNTAVEANATGEGRAATVTAENVTATSSDGGATGVDASSAVTIENSSSPSSEGETYSQESGSAPVGTGGTTTVEVSGDVKAEGTGYSVGVDATATGEGSTTTVTADSVTATSSGSAATGVTAISDVATERSESYSSEGETSSNQRTNTPTGTGGETEVKIGGDITAKGAGYTVSVEATATGEGSKTTVETETGNVEAKSTTGSATGIYADSDVATTESSESSGSGDTYSHKWAQTPTGTGGTTTVVVGGNVTVEGAYRASGIEATARGEGSTTTVTVDGTVDVKSSSDRNVSGVYAHANPYVGYSDTDGSITEGSVSDGGIVTVTTGNVTVTIEKAEAAGTGTESNPGEGTPTEDLPDEYWEYVYQNPYGADFGYETSSYPYDRVAGVNASTVDYGNEKDDSSKRTVTVTTGDVTVTAPDNTMARGVNADGKGTTVETGAVTVEAGTGSAGIRAGQGAEVTADGNVKSSGLGVVVADGGSIKVKGDVTAEDSAIAISLRNADDAKSKITIEGTADGTENAISLNLNSFAQSDEARAEMLDNAKKASTEAYNAAINEGKTNEEAYNASKQAYMDKEREAWNERSKWLNSDEGVNAIVEALPQIIVQSIPQEENVDMVMVTGLKGKNAATVSEKLLSQINYIVNRDKLDLANVAVYGYETLDGYLVAKETTKLTVKSIGNGSIAALSAGQYATVVKNGDGSYTITVNRGGDLRLMANFIAGVVAEGGTGGASGKTYGDDSPYQGKVFLYVEENKLVADMTVLSDATILTSTLMRFVQKNGVDTFVALTANGSFTIAIDELIELLDGADCFTIVVKGDTMDLYGNWKPITTLSLMSNT